MRQIEWTEAALRDLGSLERSIARRIVGAVERFAAAGSGDVKKLQGIDPPEYRLRVGDHRVRFGLRASAILVLRVSDRKDAYR